MSVSNENGSDCYVVEYADTVPTYSVLREAYPVIPELATLQPFGVAHAAKMQKICLNNAHITATPRFPSYTADASIFNGCVFSESSTIGKIVFDNCTFIQCVFFMQSSASYHLLLHECRFFNCTFILLKPQEFSYLNALVWEGASQFVGGIRNYATVFAPYYTDELLPAPHKDFVMWKKAALVDTRNNAHTAVLVELEVSHFDPRSRAYELVDDKIRVARAFVRNVYSIRDIETYPNVVEMVKGDPIKPEAYHIIKSPTAVIPIEYVIGAPVNPDGFDTDRTKTCSQGIHGYVNIQSAIDYPFY